LAAALVAGLAGFAFGLVAAAAWLHILTPLETAILIIGYGLIVQGMAVWKLRHAAGYDALLAWLRVAAAERYWPAERPERGGTMVDAAAAPPASIGGAAKPSFGEAFRVWLKIGCLSFGGPTGQIAMMHRVLVDEKKWVDEQRFLHALNYCMLLPGPEATQLAPISAG